jgi:hypothetical protein
MTLKRIKNSTHILFWINVLLDKALRNWKISVKALTKPLRKLMIITKQKIAIIIITFVNVND